MLISPSLLATMTKLLASSTRDEKFKLLSIDPLRIAPLRSQPSNKSSSLFPSPSIKLVAFLTSKLSHPICFELIANSISFIFENPSIVARLSSIVSRSTTNPLTHVTTPRPLPQPKGIFLTSVALELFQSLVEV